VPEALVRRRVATPPPRDTMPPMPPLMTPRLKVDMSKGWRTFRDATASVDVAFL